MKRKYITLAIAFIMLLSIMALGTMACSTSTRADLLARIEGLEEVARLQADRIGALEEENRILREQVALLEHRHDAINSLTAFVRALDADDFSSANWVRIGGYAEDGVESINFAATIAEVDNALAAARGRIRAVTTNAITFPSVLGEFCVDDFDEEFFESYTLVIVPVFYPVCVYGFIEFYTIFVEGDELIFLAENTFNYGANCLASSHYSFVAIISNDILNVFNIGKIKMFYTYGWLMQDYENELCYNYELKKSFREWLNEVEMSSINHKVGVILNQNGRKMHLHYTLEHSLGRAREVLAISDMDTFNEILETASWRQIPQPCNPL